MNPLNISYQDMQDAVLNQSTHATAAEAHGLLCGLLCLDGGISSDEWLDYLFGGEGEANEQDRELLDALFETSRRQLDEFDFSFDLLLPEDEAPLAERADALGEWCGGFLAGLGYRAEGVEWSEECTDILRDLAEISRLDPDAPEDGGEPAYTELAEYVRVAVQVIRSEVQPGPASPPIASLH